MEKTTGLYDTKYLTKKNRVSFALSGFGQNLIIGFVNSFILFFYTDIFVIGAGAAGILMIVARVWDALNDPIMGTIVDKTRSRWGKMRPYLLFISLPLAVSTILLFLNPTGLSLTGRIIYAYITYIVWGMIYTVCDVPFWGLASVMTPNPKERVSFISVSRLVHSVGGALPLLIIPIVTKLVGNEKGYTLAGIIIGILGGGLFLLSFFGTEERCEKTDKAPTLKECMKYLAINKPLRSVVLANVLGFMRALPVVAGMYIATYLIKDAPFGLQGGFLNTLIAGAWGVSGYLGMILTPKICNKFNYRQIYYAAAVIGTVFSVLMFFIGSSFYSIFICLLFCGFPFGVVSNINYAMIADSVEYVEWKTGKRTEGVTVSFQTLMNKMMSALQTGLVALALVVVNFIEPIKVGKDTVTQEQTDATLRGLFFLVTILPAIGWIISAIPMRFYSFIGKEREEAYIALTARRNKSEDGEAEQNDGFTIPEIKNDIDITF